MPVRAQHRWEKVRVTAWVIIASVGALYAWAQRNQMDVDGMSYLDMAHAFARGDWQAAVNRYWSPLYPALIVLVVRALHPVPYWEFAAVHLVNFLIYLAALAGFDFFLIQFVRYHRTFAATLPQTRTPLPVWAVPVVGYTVFAHSTLELGAFPGASPDVCVSAIVYVASGLLLRIALRPAERLAFPLLGVVLGVGYLAKVPMFPLAFVFLVLGAVTVCRYRPVWGASLRIAAGLAGFAVVVAALVLAFRATDERWTLGDSGKLNYAWFVDGLPIIHWQGEPPGSGRPIHPTRKIFPSPPVYEFARPVGGTYPPWFDPAYWYEGVRTHFDAEGEQQVLLRNAGVVLVRILGPQASLAIAVILLLYLGRGGGLFLRYLRAYGVILIPAVAAFGMFSLVHLDPRFVVAFVVIVWLALFAAIPWPASTADQRTLRGLIGATVAMLIVFTLTTPESSSYRTVRALGQEILGQEDSHPQWTVAQGLSRLGVQRGDSVAVIGRSFEAYWALLSGSKIVAEMPACVAAPHHGNTCLEGQPDGVSAFLGADRTTRNRLLRAFTLAGAKVVVIRLDEPPPLPGWQRISGTNYYAYLLGR